MEIRQEPKVVSVKNVRHQAEIFVTEQSVTQHWHWKAGTKAA